MNHWSGGFGLSQTQEETVDLPAGAGVCPENNISGPIGLGF